MEEPCLLLLYICSGDLQLHRACYLNNPIIPIIPIKPISPSRLVLWRCQRKTVLLLLLNRHLANNLVLGSNDHWPIGRAKLTETHSAI